MKNTKKILALVMALFTLLSVMAIPSYAAKSIPKVEFIEFTDEKAVSVKQMEIYFNEIEDMYEEWGELVSVFENEMTLEDERFYLEDSGVDYNLVVTLSTGEEIELDTDNYFGEFTEDGDYYVYAYMSVTYAQYMEAKRSNADAINVTVNCYVEDEDYNYTESEFQYEKDLVDCYVRSITPVSGIPTYIYENCDYIHNIIGGKFLVTYADGQKETLTVAWDDYGYTLGGKDFSAYVDYDTKTLECEFIDGRFEKTIIPIAEPFKTLEITECDYNSRYGTVNIKYDITLKNGTVKSFESMVDFVEFNDVGYYIIDSYLGFDIYLAASDYKIDENDKIDADNYLFTVEIGYENAVSDTYEIENPMGFFVKIRVWFELLIEKISDFFYNIFGGLYY